MSCSSRLLGRLLVTVSGSTVAVVGCGGVAETSTAAVSTGGSTAAAGTSAQGGSASGASGSGGTSVGGSGVAGGGAAGVGGSGVGGSGAGGGVAGAGGEPTSTCPNGTPIVLDGVDTGYIQCPSGQVERHTIQTRPASAAHAAMTCTGVNGATDQCHKDSDCGAPNEWCQLSAYDGGPQPCECVTGCLVDADCAAGNVCECGDPVGTCVPATCTSDAACASGRCSKYESGPCGPNGPFRSYVFGCESTGDTCEGDLDCASGSFCSVPTWMMKDATSRSCELPQPCATGRPMIVDETLRHAALARRSDWS